MNIAIEYILRNRRIEKFFSLPCSIFLETKDRKKKQPNRIVVTMAGVYGSNRIIVRQHDVENVTKSAFLPTFRETIIDQKDVFNHPDVVLPSYKLLEFQEQPYNSPEKQSAEIPIAAIQDRQYNECLTTFFSPRNMNRIRENWLWWCFDEIYCTNKMKHRIWSKQPETSRAYLFREDKAMHRLWMNWTKTLLINTDPASELVFGRVYNSEFLEITFKKPKRKRHEDIFFDYLAHFS